jgi:hypothetical protein
MAERDELAGGARTDTGDPRDDTLRDESLEAVARSGGPRPSEEEVLAERDRFPDEPDAGGAGGRDVAGPEVGTPLADDDLDDASAGLLAHTDADRFRASWREIQTGFVDAPRESVAAADDLVRSVVEHLDARFTDARSALESTWSSGGDVSTEDLRLVLTRYRSFFERLLAA